LLARQIFRDIRRSGITPLGLTGQVASAGPVMVDMPITPIPQMTRQNPASGSGVPCGDLR